MTSSEVILGTSITCSGTPVSMSLWSTICAAGTSRDGTGTNVSSMGSTVRCGTRFCGPPAALRRLPHRTARRTPYPRPLWSSTCSTWPPWSLPWPPSAGLFFVQAEDHQLGRRSLPDLGRVVHLALLLPGPGLLLSP